MEIIAITLKKLKLEIYVLFVLMFAAISIHCLDIHDNLLKSTDLKDQLASDETKNFKRVLIRADDVTGISPGFQWMSKLVADNHIAATFAVIPYTIRMWTPIEINYYKDLNRSQIELATHGYQHEYFSGDSYSNQEREIRNGTYIMENSFYRPYTFIAPFDAADAYTLDACEALGYHSISADYVNVKYPGIDQFAPSIIWEKVWPANGDDGAVSHINYSTFKERFDEFLASNVTYFVIEIHPSTFWTDYGTGQERKDDTRIFQEAINYMKSKGVLFNTFEQAHILEHL